MLQESFYRWTEAQPLIFDMKAIVLNQPGEFEHITREHPGKPGAGQVLLKIKRLSVCGTDLHAFKGVQPFFSYPRILGHEIAAEVVETGAGVSHLKAGDQCAVEPYRNAVADQAVRRGKTTCGSGLTVLGVHEDGAMQEYILYAAEKLHEANGLTPDDAALVEPFAIGSHAVERAEITPNDILLVVGAGPIGIAVMMMARLKGVRIIALDTNASRLSFVSEKFGDIETLQAGEQVLTDLEGLLNGDLPTIVIDATGNEASMSKSFDYVAAGGTIVFVGLFQGFVSFHDPSFHKKELTLRATRAAEPADFKKVIRLLKAGLLDTEGYISHRMKFDETIERFTDT
jgi:2-desacetyl-2-hydroxyethyl bacteriochlorophyllide A dehydrogenase